MLKETGERQVKKKWAQVDFDHRMRYEFAASMITDGARVADMGCGIGYGSYFIATSTSCQSVLGIDISEEAIAYAKECYSHPKVTFLRGNVLELQDKVKDKFDLITAFEVVEHIENAKEFLKQLAGVVSEKGIIVLSTPNETVLPFEKKSFHFHCRHYTLDELKNLVHQAGLEVIHTYSQNGTIVYGFPGNAMHVFVCQKKTAQEVLTGAAVILDTPLNRLMACFERLDWLLDHVPQKDTKASIIQMELAHPTASELFHHMVVRKDKFFREYSPEKCLDNPNFTDVMGPLQEGTRIRQIFFCDKNELCAVSVLPAIYERKFAGRLIATLYDEKSNLVMFHMFSEIQDNHEIVMWFIPIRDSAGKNFCLELYLECLEKDSALTFYLTDQIEGMPLYKNEKQVNKTLTYRMLFG